MKKMKKVASICLVCAIMFSVVPISSLAADNVNIIFDSNYTGSDKVQTKSVAKGKALAFEDIPTPSRKGYTFAGWYKVKDGELQYQSLQSESKYGKSSVEVLSKDTTLYAQWIEDNHIRYVESSDGAKNTKLGYSTFSGVNIIRADGSQLSETELVDYINASKKAYPVFKDLNKNGKLDIYEDWRKDSSVRAEDLAKQLSNKEIAGLMLYSSHQSSWTESKSTVLPNQISFLSNDDLRHVLIAGAGSTADVHALWNNTSQTLTERFGKGIPANNSSDPRHSAALGVEFYSNNEGSMSIWPTSLGITATFDESNMLEFGKVASSEYRAFGIATALSPQIDISTDPRWNRTSGTFGEDPRLATSMTQAYVTGFQGTFANGSAGEWGYESVNAMIKHWPGGGAGESGRDAHSDFGKYSVFPGRNFQAHIIPFVDGALAGKSGSIEVATAVMPYYTITNNVDPTGTDVANAFSEYMINDLLRNNYQYEGVICTDWGVDTGRGWGPSIEDMNPTERAYILIMSGINQFGGQDSSKYILEAREIAQKNGQEKAYDAAMQISASKLLLNVFKVGLFENPYLDPAVSKQIASNVQNNKKGIDTQVKAIVMLKNAIPKESTISSNTKVYVPKSDKGAYIFTNKGIDGKVKFAYENDPSKADIAIVPLNSPTNPGAPTESFFGGGWHPAEGPLQPKGYFPLSLQYSEYTAVYAREMSIAGDYRDKDVAVSASILNRSYKDKITTASNFDSLQTLLNTKESMGDKPVIAVLNIDNPTVMTEIDAAADVILGRFACSDAAVLEILTGAANSTGMLPLQMPSSMKSVEKQNEDVPRDLDVYIDSQGHHYDFGYGLTLVNGSYKVIGQETKDARYDKYVKPMAMTKPNSKINNHITEYAAFETIMIPVGVVGKSYNADIKAESNATVSLVRVEQNVDKTAGELPNGLKFENGKITGTPSKSGAVQLVLKAAAQGKKDRLYRINLLILDKESVKQADPNELSIAITLANAAKKSNYKAAEWTNFESKLEAAKTVYSKSTSSGGFKTTQIEIDKATKELQQAKAALIRNK